MDRFLIHIVLSNDGLRQMTLRVAILFIACGSIKAQVYSDDRPVETRGSFFLTEFGLRYNTAGNRFTVPFTLGWMKAINSRNAFGGIIGLDPDTENSEYYFSFGPRYRYLLSQNTSLGCMVSLTAGNSGFRTVNLQAIWMNRDVVGLDAGVIFDMFKEGDKKDSIEPFIGARFGSKLGMSFYKLMAVFLLILILNPIKLF